MLAYIFTKENIIYWEITFKIDFLTSPKLMSPEHGLGINMGKI